MSRKNPFGDDESPKQKVNPFGEDVGPGSVEEAAIRVDQAARKIRNLKNQMGAEGLTLNATRDLIDEIAIALETSARALRQLEK